MLGGQAGVVNRASKSTSVGGIGEERLEWHIRRVQKRMVEIERRLAKVSESGS